MESLVARCRICKVQFLIPEMGPCSDLEYEKYLQDSGVSCKCGNNDGIIRLISFSLSVNLECCNKNHFKEILLYYLAQKFQIYIFFLHLSPQIFLHHV